MIAFLKRIDRWLIFEMHKYGFILLRYSLAIVFIWFGILKPLGWSPAAELVHKTVYWVDSSWFVPFLGWWEVLIGIFMLHRKTIRLSILLLLFQMPGTFFPLIYLPEITYHHFPFGLTLEGQYIIKNLILISAAIAVGGTVSMKDTKSELH